MKRFRPFPFFLKTRLGRLLRLLQHALLPRLPPPLPVLVPALVPVLVPVPIRAATLRRDVLRRRRPPCI